MTNYKQLWKNLKQDLGNQISKLPPEYKDYVEDHEYAICGSPLKSAKILVLGKNWGGRVDSNRAEYREMPWANELLAGWTFAQNLRRCFYKILGNEEKTIYLIWKHTVYTNVCLFRTPNTLPKNYKDYRVTNRDVYKKGIDESRRVLMEIIQAVKPEIIICSGNGADNKVPTPTAVVAGMTTGNNKDYRINWWKDEDVKGYKMPRNNFYVFERNLEGLATKVTILSFPHFSSPKYTLTKDVIQVCRDELEKKGLL